MNKAGSSTPRCRGTFPIASLFLSVGLAAALSILPASPSSGRSSRFIWTSGGAAVTTAAGEQGLNLALAPDGTGGFFIAWDDRSAGKVLVQRVNPFGQSLWQAGGILVTPGTWFETGIRVVEDGAGGAIVVWVDGRNGWCSFAFAAECDIYAQRFNAVGQALWQAGGVPVTNAERNQGVSGLAIMTDQAGGAIVAWEDARPPNCCRFYAQRLSASGQQVWTKDGIPVSAAPTWIIGPVGAPPLLISDTAGGAIMAWLDTQVNPATEAPKIALQRIGPTGTLLWGSGVSAGRATHVHFALAPDGSGGALAAWSARGADGFPDVYVQRVNGSGQLLMPVDGAPAVQAPLLQINPQIVSDGVGGAIVTWEDDRNFQNFHCPGFGGNCEIYAQRLNAAGQVIWTPGGVPIATAAANQFGPRLATDGKSGAIIVWHDCRNSPGRDPCLGDPVTLTPGGMDLYGQRVNAAGQTLWGTSGVPVAQAAGNQGTHYGSNLTASFAMMGDGSGGAFLAWPDGRNGFCVPTVFLTLCDVFVQHVAYGRATAGLYNPATGMFFLRDTNSAGSADLTLQYGPAGLGWIPLVGDWNNDGVATVGVYNPTAGTFFLRNSNTQGVADVTLQYGPPSFGWIPLVGDWNGDGVVTVGVYNPASGTFFLRNSNTTGIADVAFVYGPGGLGWIPLVGDWNGDGMDTIGLYNPTTSTFFLRNLNSAGAADTTFGYGPAGLGWMPLTGDWDGDGTITVGLYNPSTGTFFLRNANTTGVADLTFAYGPAAVGWIPSMGDWGGTAAFALNPLRRR